MTLLSSDQLAQVRAQQEATLDRTCGVVTITPGASDSAGGFAAGTETSASVACRIAPPTGRDREIAARLGLELDAVITLAHGTSVAPEQEITDTATGARYQVVHANPAQSWRTATRVYARQLV